MRGSRRYKVAMKHLQWFPDKHTIRELTIVGGRTKIQLSCESCCYIQIKTCQRFIVTFRLSKVLLPPWSVLQLRQRPSYPAIVAPSRQDGVGFESTLFTHTLRPGLDFCDPFSFRCLVKAAALLLSTVEPSVQGAFPSIESDTTQRPMRALCLLTMGIQHLNSPSPDI